MARVDYDQMAASYDRGRALALEALEGWRATLADWLPPGGGLPVLDLGAGIGLFAAAIVTWFDTPLVAVEPSAGCGDRPSRPARTLAWPTSAGGPSGSPCATAAAAPPGCRPSSTTSATCPAAPESFAGSFIREAQC